MNNKLLKNLADKSETAGRILRMVAERQRNTVYTAFSGLRADLKKRDGSPVNRAEFDETFKELEAIGAGKVEKSDRGTFLGFTWSIPLRRLGTILKNKDEVGSQELPKAKGVKTNLPEHRRKVTLIILRRNKQVETIQTDEAHLKALAQ